MSIPEPTTSPKSETRKMALTETERKLIEDYRRRTEADRAFNLGLDHAIECCEAYWDSDSILTKKDFIGLLAEINKARKNV
jgi:hypothetical protein